MPLWFRTALLHSYFQQKVARVEEPDQRDSWEVSFIYLGLMNFVIWEIWTLPVGFQLFTTCLYYLLKKKLYLCLASVARKMYTYLFSSLTISNHLAIYFSLIFCNIKSDNRFCMQYLFWTKFIDKYLSFFTVIKVFGLRVMMDHVWHPKEWLFRLSISLQFIFVCLLEYSL